jgi:DNA-binding MarR family transcriptional regulator
MKGLKRQTVANIVGALAHAVVDAIEDDVAKTVRHGPTAAAALVHLSKYDGDTINALRVPLELSHPGCVRMVDRLEGRKLVTRADTSDGRAVAVELTASGTAAARAVLRRRSVALHKALGALSPREVQVLGQLASKVLTRLVENEPQALRVCRLCDYRVCPDGVCPVGAALEAAAATPGAPAP